ncbi:1,4-dihydroxy-2-naphthoate polyprenyltransferase [Corynebacterium cystitidis]|uniref:1,4-dihydroxy-2-naphthoate octaprenyltransferase n=1 Tax=Corynebacterium cystitidis DSM 20524 TaxID=1121357 RepID=A0A1H9VIZ4_9CORY|nr:1,4-dihydroxy-2-naphthoate polyprenyltransferase [Corynebacterium cystitidis]WJY81429.1 1,4-dihydroxy-2-naphthoate octaprenyltransferase [Corynebacterium cystitidis DSM 20524]SES21685.1 1,4-dihydroxy-2-naphthoate prenyltransferase [Corynebacterium cystitidis DSM 20524]SNV87509.1 1,4-dihydroxy-2-naphthoate octaprenyltransferase [Corynebacterium cystitidis]
MTTSYSASHSATRRDWWEASRPHTWANAWAPVIVGTGAAAFAGGAHFGRALLALIVAWALIIGVNFSNDYSDGVRGTDSDEAGRTGPTRLTGSGLANPKDVKRAALISFGVAAVAGIVLSLWSAWWFILVGAACIAGAWFYTGGKNPYGYRGLGEIAVFIFFGLVAVLGTEYTQAGSISWVGVAAAVGIGAISASVNMANNIRDIPSDSATGKKTLAVRLGERNARRLFAAFSIVPFVMSLLIAAAYLPALIGLIALPLALQGAITVLKGARGKDLIPVLSINGKAMLVWAIATTVALFFGALN